MNSTLALISGLGLGLETSGLGLGPEALGLGLEAFGLSLETPGLVNISSPYPVDHLYQFAAKSIHSFVKIPSSQDERTNKRTYERTGREYYASCQSGKPAMIRRECTSSSSTGF